MFFRRCLRKTDKFRRYIDWKYERKNERAPTRHDNVDFKSIIIRTSEIKPLSIAVADKDYDNQENQLLRECLKAYSIIPTRHMLVPIWRMHGRYRKQMKIGYTKLLHNQNVTRMKP